MDESKLFSYSESFHEKHSDLLPEGFGVISMAGQTNGHEGSEVPPITTIIFDARQAITEKYVWEVTTGNGGRREISQLAVTPQNVTGTEYKTSVQGALLSVSELELEKVQDILGLLDSEKVAAKIEEAYARKERIKKALATLIASQAQDNWGFSPSKVKEKAVAAQTKMFKKTGFTPLPPYNPTSL